MIQIVVNRDSSAPTNPYFVTVRVGDGDAMQRRMCKVYCSGDDANLRIDDVSKQTMGKPRRQVLPASVPKRVMRLALRMAAHMVGIKD
ncbi:MAG: hypothetical protein EOO40_09845 [Deltaproteobacteria bacterium]|nr:MAG: hypothetical protein EOO40_09845 [Deltaproteobacteria bacterium]